MQGFLVYRSFLDEELSAFELLGGPFQIPNSNFNFCKQQFCIFDLFTKSHYSLQNEKQFKFLIG